MTAGWIKLWRKLLETPALRHETRLSLFVRLLLKAAHEPTTIRFRGQDVELDVGQVVIAERDEAEALACSRKQVRAALTALLDAGLIQRAHYRVHYQGPLKRPSRAHQRAHPPTTLTICNYSFYQGLLDEEGPLKGPLKGPTEGPENKKDSTVPSEQTPAGVASNGQANQPDLDAILYARGKALLGQKAGGQITKLREALGGTGAALEAIDQAGRKENPAEYIAGVLRRNTKPSRPDAAARMAALEAVGKENS